MPLANLQSRLIKSLPWAIFALGHLACFYASASIFFSGMDAALRVALAFWISGLQGVSIAYMDVVVEWIEERIPEPLRAEDA